MGTALLERKRKIVTLQKEKLKRTYPKLWLAKYHHKTTHLQPMRFTDRFAFLVTMYKEAEKYPVSCVRKSVQCGVTDWLVICTLDEATKGLRILYVMPNEKLRDDFVKDRINVLLDFVAYYKENVKNAVGDSDSIGLKHFSTGLLNFIGSKSKAGFVSFQADSLIIDEVDQCDQGNLVMAPDRMDGSDYKHDRRVGNPSVSNWGIDAVYQKSSQGVWAVQCDKCGKWQQLNFFKNVVKQTGEITFDILMGDRLDPKCVCKKCKREMNRFGKGQWVHKYKNVSRRGYYVNQMFSANVTLAGLVDKFYNSIGNEVKTQLFYNSNLGLPYASSGSKLTYEVLEKVADRTSYILTVNNPKEAVNCKRLYVGIDVGKYFHIIGRSILASGYKKLVFVGKIAETKTLVSILKLLNPNVIVIDRDPEVKKVNDMKKVLHKMFSCRFQMGETLLGLKKNAEEYKRRRGVRIDRTFILDCVKESYSTGKIINPVNAKDLGNEDMEDYGEYYQHLLASTRTFDETGNRFVWRESSADHFFLAEGYCDLAEKLDDRILDYYSDKVDEFEGKDLYEVEADLKKQGEIIPKNRDGSVDIERLRVMSAEVFLRRIFNHTEDIMGGGK